MMAELTEHDLQRVQEFYRDRRSLLHNLNEATKAIGASGVQLSFSRHGTQGSVWLASVDIKDGEQAAQILAIARKALEERLKDIDASLKILGFAPPKDEAPQVKVK